MKIRVRAVHGFWVGLLSVTLLSGCETTSNKGAATKPTQNPEVQKLVRSGSLTIKGRSYALIVSGTWGSGVLKYRGKKYKIKAKTVGAGYALGRKDINIQATVYNLKKLQDIGGNYYGAGAGATLGKGVSASNITNSKNVTLGMRTVSRGPAVDASAGLKTLSIKLVSSRPLK